jgi:hypothetical protein
MPNKRQAGWPSLLVTFLLATQEKSDSAAEGRRKLFFGSISSKSIARKRAPAELGNSSSFKGSSAQGSPH